MRLWSIHPQYLDTKGLVALWREALLAKNVLEGKTKGYKNHPQLIRFKECPDPLAAINFYLSQIYQEARKRKYKFDKTKFISCTFELKIKVNSGQVNYEKMHILNKLNVRDKVKYYKLKDINNIKLHPLFKKVKGDIESWEKL